MKLLYKPFGFALSMLAGILGEQLFNYVWGKLDDKEPPEATTEETSWRRLLAVAAIQGMIFRVTRFAVDRWGAIGWRHLTGTWPGAKKPDPVD